MDFNSITIGEVFLFLAAVAGALSSWTTLSGWFKSKHDRAAAETTDPIIDRLDAIQKATDRTSEEVKHLVRMQLAMVDELESLGKVNGKTKAARDNLQEFLINETNEK